MAGKPVPFVNLGKTMQHYGTVVLLVDPPPAPGAQQPQVRAGPGERQSGRAGGENSWACGTAEQHGCAVQGRAPCMRAGWRQLLPCVSSGPATALLAGALLSPLPWLQAQACCCCRCCRHAPNSHPAQDREAFPIRIFHVAALTSMEGALYSGRSVPLAELETAVVSEAQLPQRAAELLQVRSADALQAANARRQLSRLVRAAFCRAWQRAGLDLAGPELLSRLDGPGGADWLQGLAAACGGSEAALRTLGASRRLLDSGLLDEGQATLRGWLGNERKVLAQAGVLLQCKGGSNGTLWQLKRMGGGSLERGVELALALARYVRSMKELGAGPLKDLVSRGDPENWRGLVELAWPEAAAVFEAGLQAGLSLRRMMGRWAYGWRKKKWVGRSPSAAYQAERVRKGGEWAGDGETTASDSEGAGSGSEGSGSGSEATEAAGSDSEATESEDSDSEE